MQDSRAARRYALALYEVAIKHEVVDSVEADLRAFTSLLESDAEFRRFFVAPTTSRPEKIEIVGNMFSDRITALTLELIRLMLSKGREREVASVKDEFIKLRRQNTGVTHATVTSAVEMTAAQQSALRSKLGRLTGTRIEADFEVDPRLIGGVRVTYNNNAIDGSIQAALTKLRDQFHHDVLKQA